jgi:FAD/FMN-containing dehydrogenase
VIGDYLRADELRGCSDRRHVGDGNFHCGLIFLPEDFKKADEAAHRMVDRAIALGGTCTGERGLLE